ncbi:hypothetical protein CRENBAI_006337 [Crenichthys baileyi]|uniref:Uncharacterized protein n=1 Tax=Crenichthys baileyi TaxID=28760 RepID=A0AAV9QMI0_9TELE
MADFLCVLGHTPKRLFFMIWGDLAMYQISDLYNLRFGLSHVWGDKLPVTLRIKNFTRDNFGRLEAPAARALLKDCYGELTSVAPRWLRGLGYLLVFQQRGAGPPIPTPLPPKLQKCYFYYTYHYH